MHELPDALDGAAGDERRLADIFRHVKDTNAAMMRAKNTQVLLNNIAKRCRINKADNGFHVDCFKRWAFSSYSATLREFLLRDT